MKFKDVVKGEVFADIYANFFQKIQIVDKNGATVYNAISLVSRFGNYDLKRFNDNEEIGGIYGRYNGAKITAHRGKKWRG